jgi:hypothetical protein
MTTSGTGELNNEDSAKDQALGYLTALTDGPTASMVST